MRKVPRIYQKETWKVRSAKWIILYHIFFIVIPTKEKNEYIYQVDFCCVAELWWGFGWKRTAKIGWNLKFPLALEIASIPLQYSLSLLLSLPLYFSLYPPLSLPCYHSLRLRVFYLISPSAAPFTRLIPLLFPTSLKSPSRFGYSSFHFSFPAPLSRPSFLCLVSPKKQNPSTSIDRKVL